MIRSFFFSSRYYAGWYGTSPAPGRVKKWFPGLARHRTR